MAIKERIDSLMQQEIDDNNALASELFIYRDFRLIYEGSFGSLKKDETVKPGKDKTLIVIRPTARVKLQTGFFIKV